MGESAFPEVLLDVPYHADRVQPFLPVGAQPLVAFPFALAFEPRSQRVLAAVVVSGHIAGGDEEVTVVFAESGGESVLAVPPGIRGIPHHADAVQQVLADAGQLPAPAGGAHQADEIAEGKPGGQPVVAG